MLKLRKMFKKNLLFIIVGLTLLAVYIFTSTRDTDADLIINKPDATTLNIEESVEKEERNTSQKEKNMIYIDLKGEVTHPGVYAIQLGARVKDVLDDAGGFTEEADPLMINLAQVLEDEMVIYVPKKGEQMATVSNHIVSKNDGLLNINKATATDFEALDGIGPAKAEAIVAYRTENGNFNKLDELMKVSGIGEGVFNQIKDEITIN